MATLYRPKAARGDDDLEILNPDRVIRIGSADWTMREYTFVEGARLFPVGERIARIQSIGVDDVPALLALLEVATGHDSVELAGLSDADFDRLVAEWRELNGPLFLTTPSRARGKPMRWADAYSSLIAAGHDPTRIARYTGRQVNLYLASIQRMEHRRRANSIVDMTYGFSGGKEAKDQVSKLQREPS